MVIPLTTGTRAIGSVWCVQTDTERSFSDEQVEFATVVGTQIALAIENASIYDNEYTMRKSLEAIEAISEAGLASLDMEEVLIQLVTRTQDVMQMDAAMILLVDDQEENLEVRAATGLVASPLATKSIAIGEGLPGKAFKRGMPMKIDNISDYDTEMCPFGSNTGITSVMAVPLKIEGKTAGVLQIGSLCESAFAAREWGLIQVLADRASHAVQNSMLHEQTRKELARAALLRDVAAACASSRDIVKIADRSLEAIHKHLGCEVASIYDLDTDEEQLTSLASTGHPEDLKDEILTVPLEGDTFLVRAVLQQTIITHDSCPTSEASETELAILRTLDALDSRRAAMPIIYRGEVIGGMALTMPGCHPFTPMELDTLKSITDQLAVALHGSRLADDNRVPPQVDD
jgi:GAF domain-containing protein